MPFTPLTQDEGEMMEHYVCQCVSLRVCERDREPQERTVGRGIKHSSLIRHNLSGATSQYHTISHILRITNLAAAGLLRRSVELFLPPLALALALARSPAAGPRYSFAAAQMGEAAASVARYRMQKCLVCFSADKADIL